MQLDTIYNSDYREGILQIDKKINLIICDPPYDISISGNVEKVNCSKKRYDNEYASVYKQLRDSELHVSYDIVNFYDLVVHPLQGKNVNCYFFCNKKQIPLYFDKYVTKEKCKFNLLIWHKRNAMPTYYNKYLTDCEYLLHFYKGNARVHPENYIDAQTIFEGLINVKDKTKYGHPTIKPVGLIEKIIKNSSQKGDLILDAFMGSGTTAVAAIRQNRHFIGFEINKEYFNICEKRIMEEIKKKAFEDELNESKEDERLEQTPKRLITVPIVKKKQDERNNEEFESGNAR